jgi:hypothetical protein
MEEKPVTPLEIDAITSKLSKDAKAAFFDVFWKTWSSNGFGTLTKKDTELLIFDCLRAALGDAGPANIHEWARLLRLTPAKIKSMRLESYLRFGHLFGESGVRDTEKFLRNFGELRSIDVKGLKSDGDIQDVTVSFVVEDPVVQMVIADDLKSIGTFLDFHRNREVIRLRLTDFFKLVTNTVEREVIDKWIAKSADEKAIADRLKGRVTAKDWANKTEKSKLMAFLDDLAEFGKVDVLTTRLKTIFKSQSERKKSKE